MPEKNTLELELRALLEEFAARIVSTIRNASFNEVASLSLPGASVIGGSSARSTVEARERESKGTRNGRAPRGTAPERDAELAKRVLTMLSNAGGAMNARAMASELGVQIDKLAKPLKQLRDEGRIKKHGDKRATTYSVS